MCHHRVLFLRPSVDGRVRCLPLLAVVSGAATSTGVQGLHLKLGSPVLGSLAIRPGSESAGAQGTLC